jgi:HlyD family secretion protein
MIVSTPSDGMVTAMDLHPGDLIPANASIATIEEPGNPYARIYVPQGKLGELRVGSHLHVRSDSLPGETFDGIIEQIDQRAEYTPQDIQTASDRELLAFGIKVRINDPQRRLHPGTTVAVNVP